MDCQTCKTHGDRHATGCALADLREQLRTAEDVIRLRDKRVAALEGALGQEHIDRAEAVVALSPQAAQHIGKVRARDFAFFADSCPTCAALAGQDQDAQAGGAGAERVTAPWKYAEVNALAEHQKGQDRHPYTCPEHSGAALIATRDGWHCEAEAGCDYTQNWAHEADAQPSSASAPGAEVGYEEMVEIDNDGNVVPVKRDEHSER